jgi:hypothetical protein
VHAADVPGADISWALTDRLKAGSKKGAPSLGEEKERRGQLFFGTATALDADARAATATPRSHPVGHLTWRLRLFHVLAGRVAIRLCAR